jgi:hypothetical protein
MMLRMRGSILPRPHTSTCRAILPVEEFCLLGCYAYNLLKVNLSSTALFATYFMLVSFLIYSSILKMETICSTETAADFQQNTRRYIPEDETLERRMLTQFFHLFHSYVFLGLFFGPEDGRDMFLRNVGYLSTDCTALYPEDRTLHNHSCQNLKSYKITIYL